MIFPGQVISIGGSSNNSNNASSNATTSSSTYTVKAGDSLYAIASKMV